VAGLCDALNVPRSTRAITRVSTIETESPAAQARPKKRRQPWWVRVLRGLAFVYLGVCLVIAAMQTYLIFPGASTQGQRHAVVRPGSGEELVQLKTTDGTPVVGLFGAALSSDGKPLAPAVSRKRPTILYFYGNGMCLADCVGEMRAFRRLGANVMIPDFTGYGMSGGKPGEAGVYQTADACYAHLRSRSDIDSNRIIVGGWSLGAAAAIELASKNPVAALFTLSAFTSMGDMAQHTLPWLPTRLMLRHHFPNERKIAEVKCPVLMFHGRRDSIIPFEMSERLATAARRSAPEVKSFAIDEADHNDVFEIGHDVIFREIGDLVDRVARREGQAPAQP
jgi:fermentation-respiration switch protein FrsA (DUF1100 family)